MRIFALDLGKKVASTYHIAVAGFRGCHAGSNTQDLLDRVRELEDGKTVLASQVFDAERIATHLHLLISAIYSLQAFESSRGISKTLRTETLLYSSAQRQIVEAIEMLGIRPGSSNIAALVISLQASNAVDSLMKINMITGGAPDDGVLNIDTAEKLEVIKKVFKIPSIEIESAQIGVAQSEIEPTITKRILSRISIMAIAK